MPFAFFAIAFLGACLFVLFRRLRRAERSLRNAVSEVAAVYTRRKQAEDGLRKSQARLAAALAESEADQSLLAAVFTAQADPILVCGADGVVSAPIPRRIGPGASIPRVGITPK